MRGFMAITDNGSLISAMGNGATKNTATQENEYL